MHRATDLIKRLGKEAGAIAVGVARAAAPELAHSEYYSRWISGGNHGEMGYLANYQDLRRDPSLLFENGAAAESVISFAFPYFHSKGQAPEAARFAMYAHGDDYHEVLRRRLKPVGEAIEKMGHQARVCVDTAPVLERYWAQQAGIGFIGRNRMLIVPGYGSYCFLAEIITTLPLEYDSPCKQRCRGCDRCISRCPGGALRSADFDASRCLSYLTIEYRGELPAAIDETGMERPISRVLAGRVYGCDECQRACPHNQEATDTPLQEFHLRPALRDLTCEEIIQMTQPEFSTIFSHSAVKRAKLAGLQRNARAAED